MPPTVQSSYSETLTKAVAGLPADADFSADSRICEAVAGIGFGLAIAQGTSDNEGKLASAAATDFVGVTIRDKALVNDSDDLYEQYGVMSVMTRGDIWVTVGGNVSPGDDVTYNKSTGVLSSAAADANNFAVSGARWMTTATNGNLAKLRLSGELPSS